MNIRLMIEKTKINEAGLCSIYVEVSTNHKGEKKRIARIPTGEKVKPRFWSKKQEVTSSYSGCGEINSTLLKKKLEIQQLIRDNINLTPSEIKTLYENQNVRKIENILELYKDFKQFKEASISSNGMKAIISLNNLLQEFQIHSKNILTLTNIGPSFYDSFYAYCVKKELNNNTIHKRSKTLITFMNYLTDRGLNSNLDFKKWKLPKLVDADIITFSFEEFIRLVELDIPDTRLRRVQHLMIILCSTSLRFTDALKIRPYHIKNDCIVFRENKTKNNNSIPLNIYSRSMLERYNYDLTSLKISNQKFNDYIKEVCRMAEINEKISQEYYIGAEKKIEVKEKWEMASSHWGRKFFISRSIIDLNLDIDSVISISGHKDYRSVRRYIEVNEKSKKNVMNKWDQHQEVRTEK
jgi:site-specific recombinase XerD